MGAAFDAAVAHTACVTGDLKELYATRIMAAVVEVGQTSPSYCHRVRMYPASTGHDTFHCGLLNSRAVR
jgi:hypothetical protein